MADEKNKKNSRAKTSTSSKKSSSKTKKDDKLVVEKSKKTSTKKEMKQDNVAVVNDIEIEKVSDVSDNKVDNNFKNENLDTLYNATNVDNIESSCNREKNFRIIDVVIISIIMLSIGLFVGSLFLKTEKVVVYDTNNKNVSEFLSVLNMVKENSYYDVSEEQLFEAAISGMLNALDDEYADYYDSAETDNFDIKMTGSFIGAGCEIANLIDGGIIVLTVFEDSPAERAGLKVGDIILELDGMSVQDWSSSQLSEYIRNNGEEGTKIDIKVKREEEEVNLVLTRQLVTLKSVSSQLIEENGKRVGYIKMDLFALNTYDQFKSALETLEKNKIDSLIIDVRDNSGGYLSVATSIISMFIPSNKIIYQIQNKDSIDKIYSLNNDRRKYEIVVLVNENSASASEILAAALKESYGATIIGRTTYGKGTVQEVDKLANGNMIKYTIQNWLTPNGVWLESKGYVPDILVEDDSIMIEEAKKILKK